MQQGTIEHLKKYCRDNPNEIVIRGDGHSYLRHKAENYFVGAYVAHLSFSKVMDTLLYPLCVLANKGGEFTAREIAEYLWPEDFPHENVERKRKAIQIVDEVVRTLSANFNRGMYFEGEIKDPDFIKNAWKVVRENLK